MCLLLNYPLANLHVATEKAVDECGKNDQSSISQLHEAAKKIKRGRSNLSFPFAVMVRIYILKERHHLKIKECLLLTQGKSGKLEGRTFPRKPYP